MSMCVPQYVSGGQRTKCGSQSSPSSWALSTELRSSRLATSILICWPLCWSLFAFLIFILHFKVVFFGPGEAGKKFGSMRLSKPVLVQILRI